MLVGDGNSAGTPLFADLVEQRSQNSEEDIDGPELGGKGVFNELLSRRKIIPATCFVERMVNMAEKLGVPDDFACEYIGVLGLAPLAETVSDGKVVIWGSFTFKLLAI